MPVAHHAAWPQEGAECEGGEEPSGPELVSAVREAGPDANTVCEGGVMRGTHSVWLCRRRVRILSMVPYDSV